MASQSSAPRQITVSNQPQNVQQRSYVQNRTYAPVQTQPQTQPIYHVQQIQQTGDTPQSLDIQIPQGQTSSPRNYSSSPVTVVLQVRLIFLILQITYFNFLASTSIPECSRRLFTGYSRPTRQNSRG